MEQIRVGKIEMTVKPFDVDFETVTPQEVMDGMQKFEITGEADSVFIGTIVSEIERMCKNEQRQIIVPSVGNFEDEETAQKVIETIARLNDSVWLQH